MPRYIDAYALIDDIRKHSESYFADDFAHEWVDKQPSVDVQPATRWIPCCESLPEEDGLYLVTTSKEQVQMHVFNRNGNSEEYWMRCNKAWMPLPKPYKDGDADG